MKKVTLYILAQSLFLLFCLSGCKEGTENKIAPQKEQKEDTALLVNHFQTLLSQRALVITPDSGKLGLGGGVDGFILRKAFPQLLAKDFTGVIAEGGEYLEKGDTLYYNGNAASVSPRINKEGFQTLMYNVSSRKKVEVNTRKNVEDLVSELLR